jgi:type II secretory pathway pseudopilin PulG
MILTIIFLILVLAASLYGNYNLVRQNEQFEESQKAYENLIELYNNKLITIREKALQTEVKLKDIDIRGSFEADDEVGFIFKDIRAISTELTNTIQDIYELN